MFRKLFAWLYSWFYAPDIRVWIQCDNEPRQATDVIFEQLSTPGLEKRAIDAVNDFTRTRIREDRSHKRLMPPPQLANDELDRAVPTNLPAACSPEAEDCICTATKGWWNDDSYQPRWSVSSALDKMSTDESFGGLSEQHAKMPAESGKKLNTFDQLQMWMDDFAHSLAKDNLHKTLDVTVKSPEVKTEEVVAPIGSMISKIDLTQQAAQSSQKDVFDTAALVRLLEDVRHVTPLRCTEVFGDFTYEELYKIAFERGSGKIEFNPAGQCRLLDTKHDYVTIMHENNPHRVTQKDALPCNSGGIHIAVAHMKPVLEKDLADRGINRGQTAVGMRFDANRLPSTLDQLAESIAQKLQK
jgi:hypothetical protein